MRQELAHLGDKLPKTLRPPLPCPSVAPQPRHAATRPRPRCHGNAAAPARRLCAPAAAGGWEGQLCELAPRTCWVAATFQTYTLQQLCRISYAEPLIPAFSHACFRKNVPRAEDAGHLLLGGRSSKREGEVTTHLPSSAFLHAGRGDPWMDPTFPRRAQTKCEGSVGEAAGKLCPGRAPPPGPLSAPHLHHKRRGHMAPRSGDG